ncbi:MAG: hypothetical protein AB1420_11785 [Bacillota bacterium]
MKSWNYVKNYYLCLLKRYRIVEIIADACKTNIIFKALSANSELHFTTIASFISTMKEEIMPIFRNILMVCSELE